MIWLALGPAAARAQEAAPAPAEAAPPSQVSLGAELAAIEQLHTQAAAQERRLMHAVLGFGVVSVVGGGAMMITDANDQAFRVAGGCTLAFGAIDAVIALVAMNGIGRDARTWDNERLARSSAAGLQRARVRWVDKVRGQGVSYALNLGLDVAYLSSGLAAVLASQFVADHSDRWLAGGLSIAAQAVFLVGIDLYGLRYAGRLHKQLLEGLSPSVSLLGNYSEPSVRLGLAGRF
jgi:hypothetical protein